MKLTDADKLITDLKEYVENIKNIRDDDKCFLTEENVLSIIKEQPTAYDVDKVVEQLEEKSSTFETYFTIREHKWILTKEAIEIVKAGGIDE